MPEFVEGNNRITVDITDHSGGKVGPGPLMTCLSLSYDALLNQPGSYTARFPANDPRLAYLQLKKHTLAFYYDGEDDPIFYGMTDSWSYELSNDGQQILVITGRDLLGELAEIPILVFSLDDGATPIFDAPTQILLYGTVPSGWGIGGAFTTETGVYASLVGESVLSALTRIAEHIGESFRVDFRRVVWWVGAGSEASGVRAIQTAGDPIDAENNQFICFIQRFAERRDATNMITTVFPFGSGLGETQLDLEGTSRVAPAGFTLDEANNSITSDAALAYLDGQALGRRVNFKDIRPLFNTDADVQSAKDYLFDAALAYLQRNDSIDDVVEYDLDVLQLPRYVRVGMTIRVVYQDDRRDIDLDLFILGIRTTIGSDGAISYSLTVAPINQWRLRETDRLTAQIEEGEIFAAHPQIDAGAYWMVFKEEVGDDQTEHVPEFPFWLSAEVLTIRQVLYRYKVEPLLSAVGVVTYASPDTALNVASVTGPTNTAATGDTNTAASAASSAAATADTNTASSGASSAAATADTNTASSGATSTANSGNPTVTDTGASSSTATGASNAANTGSTAAGTSDSGGSGTSGASSGNTGTATGNTGATDPGATSSTAPDALTDTNFGGIATATQAADGPGSHWHDIGTHVHDFAHTHGHNTHTHSMNSHDHSLNSHTHTTPAHTHAFTSTHLHTITHDHNMPHTHGLNNHQHDIAHTHTIPHTHNMPHTHTIPHTHNMPHTHNIPHTHNMPHDHSSPQHVHAAPTLVTTYSLRRTPVLNSYVMADLEWSVNGGAWASLDSGIPVAGGYYELDVTSSIQNPAGLKRPYQEFNLIQVRRKTAAGTGKTAMIRAQIGIRQTIQSVVVYS